MLAFYTRPRRPDHSLATGRTALHGEGWRVATVATLAIEPTCAVPHVTRDLWMLIFLFFANTFMTYEWYLKRRTLT